VVWCARSLLRTSYGHACDNFGIAGFMASSLFHKRL
jgi:hypothetical protein